MNEKPSWELAQPKELRTPEAKPPDAKPRYAFLTRETDKELQDILNGLPQEITQKLSAQSSAVPTGGRKPRRRVGIFEEATLEEVAKEWEEEDRRDRMDRHRYTREDVSKLDEAQAESAFFGTLRRLLYQGDQGISPERLMRAANEKKFSDLLMPFLDSVWKNRGADTFNHCNDAEKNRLEKTLSEKRAELRSTSDQLKKIEEKCGRKKRLPESARERLSQLDQKVAEFQEKIRTEEEVLRGVTEHQKPYDALVFVSETLSAEEFAVLVSEILYVELDHISRRYPNADPQLLEYIEQTVSAWNKNHEGDPALRLRKDATTAKKLELLARNLSERLASYARTGRNSATTPEMRESNEREILVAARLVRRFAGKIR